MDKKEIKIENIETKQYSREYLKCETKQKQDEAMKILNNRFNSSRLVQPYLAN